MQEQPYTTVELELAAFLKARGHRLLRAIPQGRLVTVAFDRSAHADLDNYLAGAEISVLELFQAHRRLRALIKQIKQTTSPLQTHPARQRRTTRTPSRYSPAVLFRNRGWSGMVGTGVSIPPAK
jgi:hypothetical protein